MQFSHRDTIHLRAAEGWLELGSHLDADIELEQITPELRTHPDVLKLRYEIYSAANKWELAAELAQVLCQSLPGNSFGFIHLAFALHELKRTAEARQVLLPVVDQFSSEPILFYNLSCYACQLGDQGEAIQWFNKACAAGDPDLLQEMAIDDPDLSGLLGALNATS